jgi:predicted nucleotidyltransferase
MTASEAQDPSLKSDRAHARLPQRTAPEPHVLENLVLRIVEAVRPERIILFGSAARGTMGPHSDLDVLVVKSGAYRKIDVMHAIRRRLRGLGEAVDIVVATPEELVRYGECPALVHHAALHGGRQLYAA